VPEVGAFPFRVDQFEGIHTVVCLLGESSWSGLWRLSKCKSSWVRAEEFTCCARLSFFRRRRSKRLQELEKVATGACGEEGRRACDYLRMHMLDQIESDSNPTWVGIETRVGDLRDTGGFGEADGQGCRL